MIRPDIVLENSQRTCTITPKEEFKYKTPIPKKRSHTKESNKAIFIQREVPCFLTTEIQFSGKVNKDTAYCLEQLHRDCETIELTGQYGEVLGVEMMLEEMQYYCEHAEFSGKFMVLCEITPSGPQCEIEE